MFSTRLPATLRPNALTQALARMRHAGESWRDLTVTNPTDVSLPYASDLLEPLADSAGLTYRPRPFGLDSARAAVAEEFRRQGTPLDAERVLLTASTSEAYALLFKLLCDPGDEVLVPQPSYPLFDLLTQLEAVQIRPYRLECHGVWSIDRSSLETALTSRTRAVLVVSPNNPTGSMLRRDDRDWLHALCEQRHMALIADEVFRDYPLSPRADASPAMGPARALTFSLGGLSKSAGLPQVKLGWIGIDGPKGLVAEALQRLEVICDTYLSVSTPVQIGAGKLIAAGVGVRRAIAERLDRNLQHLRAAVLRYPGVSLLDPEGGWSAVLRVPAIAPEEQIVLRLLTDARVLVHPGYFFDFASEAFLIMSLLPAADVFDAALADLLPIASGAR